MTLVKMAFWNAGKQTIEGDDPIPGQPVRIRVEAGAQILYVALLKMTHEGIDMTGPFSMTMDDHPTSGQEADFIPLTFSSLDHHDGLFVHIIHNGPANHPIRVEGRLKGAKPIAKASENIFAQASLPIATLKKELFKLCMGLVFLFIASCCLYFWAHETLSTVVALSFISLSIAVVMRMIDIHKRRSCPLFLSDS